MLEHKNNNEAFGVFGKRTPAEQETDLSFEYGNSDLGEEEEWWNEPEPGKNLNCIGVFYSIPLYMIKNKSSAVVAAKPSPKDGDSSAKESDDETSDETSDKTPEEEKAPEEEKGTEGTEDEEDLPEKPAPKTAVEKSDPKFYFKWERFHHERESSPEPSDLEEVN